MAIDLRFSNVTALTWLDSTSSKGQEERLKFVRHKWQKSYKIETFANSSGPFGNIQRRYISKLRRNEVLTKNIFPKKTLKPLNSKNFQLYVL